MTTHRKGKIKTNNNINDEITTEQDQREDLNKKEIPNIKVDVVKKVMFVLINGNEAWTTLEKLQASRWKS